MTEGQHVLENEYLTVRIKDQGAELTSIFNKKTSLEYVWQAGTEWPKHAPVLFPIVGQLRDDRYIYKGRTYRLNRHGFARDMKFTAGLKGAEKIAMTITDDETTYEAYPFRFSLTIKYELSENTLTVIYEVENRGDDTMLFSIGGHPAFKVPLVEHEKYDDYYLQFEKSERVSRHLLTNGLFDGRTEDLLHDEIIFPFKHDLFRNDAIVLKDLRSDLITLKSHHSTHGLHFIFKGFPYLGIWAANGADFVCLEPWYGIADHATHNQNLESKEGINRIAAGKKFSCFYCMVLF